MWQTWPETLTNLQVCVVLVPLMVASRLPRSAFLATSPIVPPLRAEEEMVLNLGRTWLEQAGGGGKEGRAALTME